MRGFLALLMRVKWYENYRNDGYVGFHRRDERRYRPNDAKETTPPAQATLLVKLTPTKCEEVCTETSKFMESN